MRAEDVGTEAGQILVDNLSYAGCVDNYLQDQVCIIGKIYRPPEKCIEEFEIFLTIIKCYKIFYNISN